MLRKLDLQSQTRMLTKRARDLLARTQESVTWSALRSHNFQVHQNVAEMRSVNGLVQNAPALMVVVAKNCAGFWDFTDQARERGGEREGDGERQGSYTCSGLQFFVLTNKITNIMWAKNSRSRFVPLAFEYVTDQGVENRGFSRQPNVLL